MHPLDTLDQFGPRSGLTESNNTYTNNVVTILDHPRHLGG